MNLSWERIRYALGNPPLRSANCLSTERDPKMDIQFLLKLMNTLNQLRQHEGWARPQLEEHRVDALRRLREYAYARSPF